MKRNILFNGVGEFTQSAAETSTSQSVEQPATLEGSESAQGEQKEVSAKGEVNTKEAMSNAANSEGKSKYPNGEVEQIEEEKDAVGRRPGCNGRVKINEGDAW